MVRFNGIWRDHTGVLQQQKHHVLATKVKDQSRGSGSSGASCTTAHQIYSKFLQLSRRLACFLDRRENKYELMRYQSTVGNCSSLLPVSNSQNSFQILPHCCHLSGQLGSIVSGRCRGILANGDSWTRAASVVCTCATARGHCWCVSPEASYVIAMSSPWLFFQTRVWYNTF